MRRLRQLAVFLVLAAGAAAAAPGETHEYYVNRNDDEQGDHEVHREGCSHPPDERNRRPLGSFTDCEAAVRAARRLYPTADGCYHCSRACHTS
jgi:hypothetical protein